ncbi:MAG: hypothetical protein M0Z75_00240 [Nitrospiraceae bacterium]|nr:hypothetical protein [Nitrospiraceae bacterium]
MVSPALIGWGPLKTIARPLPEDAPPASAHEAGVNANATMAKADKKTDKDGPETFPKCHSIN